MIDHQVYRRTVMSVVEYIKYLLSIQADICSINTVSIDGKYIVFEWKEIIVRTSSKPDGEEFNVISGTLTIPPKLLIRDIPDNVVWVPELHDMGKDVFIDQWILDFDHYLHSGISDDKICFQFGKMKTGS